MHIHVCELVYISVDKQMRMDRVNIRPGFIKKYLTGPEWSYFFFYFVCMGMLFCVVVVFPDKTEKCFIVSDNYYD